MLLRGIEPVISSLEERHTAHLANACYRLEVPLIKQETFYTFETPLFADLFTFLNRYHRFGRTRRTTGARSSPPSSTGMANPSSIVNGSSSSSVLNHSRAKDDEKHLIWDSSHLPSYEEAVKIKMPENASEEEK